VTVGFIGFGEAGSTIAGGLAEAGVDRIFAFDIAVDDGRLGPTIRQRAARTGAILVESPAALAQACDILISTVTSSSALDAATAIAPFLDRRHQLNLRSHFGPDGPRTAADVAAVVARLTGQPAKPTLRGMSGSEGWPEGSTA